MCWEDTCWCNPTRLSGQCSHTPWSWCSYLSFLDLARSASLLQLFVQPYAIFFPYICSLIIVSSRCQGGAVFKNQMLNGIKELCELSTSRKARLKALASEGHVPCRAIAWLVAVQVLLLHHPLVEMWPSRSIQEVYFWVCICGLAKSGKTQSPFWCVYLPPGIELDMRCTPSWWLRWYGAGWRCDMKSVV